MKKIFLLKKPDTFLGEKNLQKNKPYFEGYYFKNTIDNYSIAFIPGICIDKDEKKAFIQVITKTKSYYINYDIDELEYRIEPFYIKIGNNIFTTKSIHIDIKNGKKHLKIYGDINYLEVCNINKSKLSPNIMGPFSYVPFMECNHAIICMKATTSGNLKLNSKTINFDNGMAYIEKDWGSSFPQKYLWCQANEFSTTNSSFMLSIASIPFKLFKFQGFICTLIANGKEYRFATYNYTKIIKYKITKNFVDVVLKKGKYLLYIQIKKEQINPLYAPIKGKMEKRIYESLNAITKIKLKYNNKVVFSDVSNNCGLEIVED